MSCENKRERGDNNEGDVIPLQFLGVEDVDVSQMSSNELLLHVLMNLGNEDEEIEGGYAVRHGRDPVFDLLFATQDWMTMTSRNKFDIFTAAFPALWPYGEGRWDVDSQGQKVSITEYV